MKADLINFLTVEDMERNDGSPERPYRASKGLMKILGVRNQPPPIPEPVYETPLYETVR